MPGAVLIGDYGELDKVPQPVLPGELYTLASVHGSQWGWGLEGGWGYRPKYIIHDCRFFLDWGNSILLTRVQFMSL